VGDVEDVRGGRRLRVDFLRVGMGRKMGVEIDACK
jgi:hypothetical protein